MENDPLHSERELRMLDCDHDNRNMCNGNQTNLMILSEDNKVPTKKKKKRRIIDDVLLISKRLIVPILFSNTWILFSQFCTRLTKSSQVVELSLL